MGLKEYIVAIPSYKRAETLRDRTLKLLQDYKISPNKIYIFVADKEEYKIYNETLPKKSYHKIVIGEPGIKNIRNFMSKYFKEGQYIVYIDDDVYNIFECTNTVRGESPTGSKFFDKKYNKLSKLKSLKELINKGFKLSEKTGLTNWGVYPVHNAYFMKPTTSNISDYVSTKAVWLVGTLTGVINNRKAEIRTIGDKEDYERTIKYYLKDDGVLRFNNVTIETKYYKEPGGIQVYRTLNSIYDSAIYLTKQYPKLCTLNLGKKSGFAEVRLRDKRENVPILILQKDGTVIKRKPEKQKKTKKIKRNPKK